MQRVPRIGVQYKIGTSGELIGEFWSQTSYQWMKAEVEGEFWYIGGKTELVGFING